MENGQTSRWEIRDKASNDLLLEIEPGTEGNYGSIRNYVLGSSVTFDDSGFVDLRIDSGAGDFDALSIQGFGSDAFQQMARASLSTEALTIDEAVRVANGAGFGKQGSINFAESVAYAFEDRSAWDAGTLPPQGKYALKILAKRPDGNSIGGPKIENGDVGHAFVAVVNGEGQVQMFGRYPPPGFFYNDPTPEGFTLEDIVRFKDIMVDDAKAYQSTGSSDPWASADGKRGLILDDSSHAFDVQTNWMEITPEVYNQIMTYKNQEQVYNLHRSNCAGFALEIAKIGGLNVNYDPWVYPNPQDLTDAIEKAKGQSQ